MYPLRQAFNPVFSAATPCQIAASQGLAILHVILIGLTVGVMAATLMTSTGAGVHPRVKVTVVALATLSGEVPASPSLRD